MGSPPPTAESTKAESTTAEPIDTHSTGTAAPDPISWDVAERVAVRVAKAEPLARSYHYASLEPDFAELTVKAEQLVEQQTGLRSTGGPARSRVADRPEWVRVNLRSFRRLLRPFSERLGERISHSRIAPAGRAVAGAEVGALLGWMSTRVLGQYDPILDEARAHEQDIVYYVGPNVLALEKRYAFPPREFRLWLALHEVTHRVQFTAVPWLRPHFLSLVDSTMAAFDPDPERFVAAVRRAVELRRSGQGALDEGGVVALFAGPEQREALQRIQGLMSVLEGHADWVMDRAGPSLVPSAPRFAQVLHQRRQSNGAIRLFQRLLGIEAKLRQYKQGEAFLEAIEASDPENLVRLWTAPETFPTLAEIHDPGMWLARVDDAVVAAAG